MTRSGTWRTRRGVAALEFALCAPVLLVMLAGLSDLGLAARSKMRLAGGVANAASYAFLTQGAASPGSLAAIVQAASGFPDAQASATAPACFCPGGHPTILAAASCGSNCADGSPAGTYVTISGSYIYTPLMPGYPFVASTTLIETATVRVK